MMVAEREGSWVRVRSMGGKLPLPPRAELLLVMVLESTLTCPACGTAHHETMPTDACVHFYECPACHALLAPKAGDCCVFCSYGTAKCPPRCCADEVPR